MTPQELADHYGVPLRTIQNDCKLGMYPYSYRTRNTSNRTHTGWFIQPFITNYPRSVWQSLRSKRPTAYNDVERDAFLMCHSHKHSIRVLADTLGITTTKIRSIYDRLLKLGYVCAEARPSPYKEDKDECDSFFGNIETCEPRSHISNHSTRPQVMSCEAQRQKPHTHNTQSESEALTANMPIGYASVSKVCPLFARKLRRLLP